MLDSHCANLLSKLSCIVKDLRKNINSFFTPNSDGTVSIGSATTPISSITLSSINSAIETETGGSILSIDSTLGDPTVLWGSTAVPISGSVYGSNIWFSGVLTFRNISGTAIMMLSDDGVLYLNSVPGSTNSGAFDTARDGLGVQEVITPP